MRYYRFVAEKYFKENGEGDDENSEEAEDVEESEEDSASEYDSERSVDGEVSEPEFEVPEDTLESKVDSSARKNSQRIKRIKSYKREFAIYSILGCSSTFITMGFMVSASVPLRFGNLTYSGIILSGVAFSAASSYYLFKRAFTQLEDLVNEIRKSN